MKRILIVDDHEVLREGVKRIFDKQVGAITFGEASSGPEALRLAREQDWDIVVLDLSLGGRNGLEVLKELKQIRPRLPVLILSMHGEVQFARRAFKAGASGYITKDSPRSELTKAINKVIDEGRYISQALAEKLVVDIGRGTDRPPHESLSDREFEVMRLIASGKTDSVNSPLKKLTPRQVQVLQLIAEGKSTKQVALDLDISAKTVECHRTQLMERLDIHEIAGLVRFAIKVGLLEIEDRSTSSSN